MSDWKIKKIQSISDMIIRCPCCDESRTINSASERNAFIREHKSCIAGDSITFTVIQYFEPVCVGACVMCNCQVDYDSHADAQICESCLQKARQIKGFANMLEVDC